MGKTDAGRMAGNKGEWSELYTFLELLSQGRVYAANEKVERIDDVYYPIVKISREEKQGQVIEYVIKDNMIDIAIENEIIMSVSRCEVKDKAQLLLTGIMTHSGSFELEDIAEFIPMCSDETEIGSK